jgi:hypothetical protein
MAVDHSGGMNARKGRTAILSMECGYLGTNSQRQTQKTCPSRHSFRVGLRPEQVLILVNNRRLMESRFDSFNIPADQRSAVSAWVDRREKMSPEAWEAYAKEIGLSEKQLNDLKSILDDKELWKQSEELTRFFAVIDALGLSDYIKFDPSIMRGLLYYTVRSLKPGRWVAISVAPFLAVDAMTISPVMSVATQSPASALRWEMWSSH